VREGITANEQLMLVRVRMPPGRAHQFHRHPHMEEALYYLEGRGEQWVGQERRILGPGDVAHVPVNEVHGTYNLFDATLVFLAILGPAKFEGPALIDVSKEEPWCSLKVPIDHD
jgi:quercetin dioxygenase-like cupin family protein